MNPPCQATRAAASSEAAAARWGEFLGSLGAVRTICSIGCGPGCDAVGVSVFLQALEASTAPNCSLDDAINEQQGRKRRVILLDWVMQQWKALVIFPLREILSTRDVTVGMAECDVRKSLLTDPIHKEAQQKLFSGYGTEYSAAAANSVDLFVISYLLSETRGQWQMFLDDIVSTSRPGTHFFID